MENNLYDIIIIGGGPAGLSAALYSSRAKLKTIIIEKEEVGGQVITTSEIANYPGGDLEETGQSLVEKMKKQIQSFDVEIVKNEVKKVDFSKDIKEVITENKEYKSKVVIIATGATPRKIGVPGEKEFTGRGVSYCATCDAPFISGLEVFAIGAGYSAAEEAITLAKYAKKVTIIAREPDFTCAKSLADEAKENEKIEILFNSELKEIKGKDMIESAIFVNNNTKKTWEYTASKEDETFGIFIFIGYAPQTKLFKDEIKVNDSGYITTNSEMQTNIKGVYAVGDIREKSLRQVVTAVSDGAIAATDAEKYINKKFDTVKRIII